MRALRRSTLLTLTAAAVLLSACRTYAPPSTKPTPPLATDCLERPQGQYTNPPQPGATLTDEWAKAIWGWANRTLGLATKDRKAWAGERQCIRKKAETGAIR